MAHWPIAPEQRRRALTLEEFGGKVAGVSIRLKAAAQQGGARLRASVAADLGLGRMRLCGAWWMVGLMTMPGKARHA